MMLSKRERNKIYEAVVKSNIDPAKFDLEDIGSKLVVSHNSGSTFEFSLNPVLDGTPRNLIERIEASGAKYRYKYRANVVEGVNQTGTADSISSLEPKISYWLREIRQTVGVPDYWTELQRSRELIANVQQTDSSNTPFTQDEQKQIAAQLQEIKKQIREQFELTNEQMAQVEERLDEAAEASKRAGRKDWLIYFLGTITALVITATVPSGLGEHIFIMAIHSLGYNSGDRQAPASRTDC